MFGPLEAHAQLAARREHPGVQGATHATDKAALERERRAAPQGQEHAPVVHEAPDRFEAGVAGSAGDVIGGDRRAEARVLGCLVEGHRARGRRDSVDLSLQLEPGERAVDDHVDFPLQTAAAHVLVAQIGVGDLLPVEGVADPPHQVGVGPRNPDTEARQRGGVTGHVGRFRRGVEIERQLAAHRSERRAQAILARQDPRAGRVVDRAAPEGLLGDPDLEARQARPRRQERLLPRVAQQEDTAVARHPARRSHLGAHRLRRRRVHPLVVDARGGHAEPDGERPRHVVVGDILRLGGEALRLEQVDRVVAVRLVELHDVGAARERSLGVDVLQALLFELRAVVALDLDGVRGAGALRCGDGRLVANDQAFLTRRRGRG